VGDVEDILAVREGEVKGLHRMVLETETTHDVCNGGQHHFI
jgi:hypothetical protein